MKSKRLRVGFIGALTNGKIVFEYLDRNRHVDLVFALTHDNLESRVSFLPIKSSPKMLHGTVAQHQEQIELANLDLIIVVGWSELIPERVVNSPSHGTIGFHPSLLPEDRGRSVLAWQIEAGYSKTGLTMFYYSDLPDGGDIIAQIEIQISPTDYIADILLKVDQATDSLIRAYFPLIRQHTAPRRMQDWNRGLFRCLRGPKESKINWDRPALEIFNKVRAISRPYPGADGPINGVLCRIWRVEVVCFSEEAAKGLAPGTTVNHDERNPIIACRESFLRVTEYEELS